MILLNYPVALALLSLKIALTPLRWCYHPKVCIPLLLTTITWAYFYHKNVMENYPFLMEEEKPLLPTVGAVVGNAGYAAGKSVGGIATNIGEGSYCLVTDPKKTFDTVPDSLNKAGDFCSIDHEIRQRKSFARTIAIVHDFKENPWNLAVLFLTTLAAFTLLEGASQLINKGGRNLVGEKWRLTCPEKYLTNLWEEKRDASDFIGTILFRYSILILFTSCYIWRYQRIIGKISFAWRLLNGIAFAADITLDIICLPASIALRIPSYFIDIGISDTISFFTDRTTGTLCHIMGNIKQDNIRNVLTFTGCTLLLSLYIKARRW